MGLLKKERDNRPKMESLGLIPHHQTEIILNLIAVSTFPRNVIITDFLKFPGQH